MKPVKIGETRTGETTIPVWLSPSIEQMEKIDTCLDMLRQRAGMLCILLVDQGGQLISQQGAMIGLDPHTLAALAAAQMAATQEIGRLVGERNGFRQLLHDGEDRRIYIGEVGNRCLLVGVVEADMLLGWVRLTIREATAQLTELFSEMRRGDCQEDEDRSDIFDTSFQQALAEEMSRAFDLDQGKSPGKPGAVV